MKIKTAPFFKSPPVVWVDIEFYQESWIEKVEYFLFHTIAALGCFGGWCLTMLLFFYFVRPI